MPTLQEATPYLLVALVIISIGGSVTYIGSSAGNSDVRNELQKHMAVITSINVLLSMVIGTLLYYYVTGNTSSFIPVTIFMLSFNIFMTIMCVSVTALQKIS
jgi:hypothetical protein